MDKLDHHLKDIAEIRSLMERSSKFLSLSGLSGVSAGIVGVIGAAVAHRYLTEKGAYLHNGSSGSVQDKDLLTFLFVDAGIVLVVAVGLAILFSTRMARKNGLPVWNRAAKYLLTNLLIPLITGGVFCLILVSHGFFLLIAPSTLIFYGLALLNVSKVTVNEIRYLGLMEIVLGLMASVWVWQALWFWAIGFGVLHIVYGIVLYYKYAQSTTPR